MQLERETGAGEFPRAPVLFLWIGWDGLHEFCAGELCGGGVEDFVVACGDGDVGAVSDEGAGVRDEVDLGGGGKP